MTESLADRMKHWRSGEELTRTKLAWLNYITQQIEIGLANREARRSKYAPRLTVVPLAGDRIAR